MTREPVRVLAFDTSAEITAVAVCQGAQVLAEDRAATPERHAEVLLPKLQQCLASAGVTLQEIDLIAVGVGPGSFTGVRVGVATAKGLGLALGKPVCPVVSLQALALEAALVEPAHGAQYVAACVDAYKGELFTAVYRWSREAAQLTQVEPPYHAAPELVAARLAAVSGEDSVALVGPGVVRYPALLSLLPKHVQAREPALTGPSPRVIAALASGAFARGDVPELARVLPVYLRDSDARLPSTPLRL